MANFVKVYDGYKAVKHEVTPWFSPEIDPVYKGLYVVGSDELAVMLWWDGKKWVKGNGDVLKCQEVHWRGWTGKTL